MQKFTAIGRIGKAPEGVKQVNGASMLYLSLATDESYRNKAGERVQKVEWHNLVVWNKLAEVCNKYVTKGMQIYVEGKLATIKNGDKSYTNIIVSNIQFLDKVGEKKEEAPANKSHESSSKGQADQNSYQDNAYMPPADFNDMDIPF